jgi:hypothetical protein
MLSWFREVGRPIASVALVSLVTFAISSAIPHADDCHGDECAAVTLHDPSSHSIGRSESSSEHPNHCVACHLSRSVRPAHEAAPLLVPVATEDVRITVDVVSLPSQDALLRPSLRAPPVSPSLT